MTYPWPTLMPMGIVVISCVRPSVQPSMGLGLCIAYKALGRNGLQFGMLMYPDGLHSAFMDAYGYCCWSVCPSMCPFVRLRHFQVDTGDICCHYWQHILVVNWNLRNKLQWNLNQITKLFTPENALKMASTKWHPFCPGGDELKHVSKRAPSYHHEILWMQVCFLYNIQYNTIQYNKLYFLDLFAVLYGPSFFFFLSVY